MASKRSAAARKPRPSPAPDPPALANEPEATPAPNAAERYLEEVLRLAGLTFDVFQEDMRAGHNPADRVLLALTRFGNLQWHLIPEESDRNILVEGPSQNQHVLAVLNDAQAQWLINEARKTLSVERVLRLDDPSKPPKVLYSVTPVPAEERAQWERLQQGVSEEEFQELLRQKLAGWMAQAQVNYKPPATPSKPPPSPAPDPAQLERLERFVEDYLRTIGLTPDACRLPEGPHYLQLTILLGLSRLGHGFRLDLTKDKNKNILTIDPSPDVQSQQKEQVAILDEAETRWFLEQAEKTLSIDKVLRREPGNPSEPLGVYKTVFQDPPEQRAHWQQLREQRQSFSPEEDQLFDAILTKKLTAWANEAEANFKASTASPSSHAIKPPDPQTHQGQPMIQQQYAPQLSHYARELGRRLTQKISTTRGVSYFPLALAAPLAQAPETTIRYWIAKKQKFGGKLIKTRRSSAGLCVSQDSIDRMAQRFIRWPSEKPAGAVTIGETDGRGGYIGFTDAARQLGVERHTIWRWTTKGTAPIDRPLDVIKDPASDQFYIAEKDVADLKPLVPRSGLRRGPRPRLSGL